MTTRHSILISLLLILSITRLSAQAGKYTPPEGYETLMSKRDYKFFVDESVRVISEQFRIAETAGGVVTLEAGQELEIINLHNLMTACAGTEREYWPDRIRGHFEGLAESMKLQKELDYANFPAMKDYLSIRIYPENYLENYADPGILLRKTHLEGTVSVLMLDLPTVFAPLEKELIASWGKTPEELFGIAQVNVNKHAFTKASHTIESENSPLEIHFIENEDYAASLALDLERNAPEFVGAWGSVVAIPNKGIVNICTISEENPLDFILFIQTINPLVEQFYREHPQPVSRSFYWYYQGHFTPIAVAESASGLQVITPLGLSELMADPD